MTHFTTRESLVEALKAIGLGDQVGIVIPSVSTSIFSVARHYGGMTLSFEWFTYIDEFDWLVQDKALKAAIKWAKAQAKQAKPQRKAEPLPLDLFGG
jgi:hypothetical protein